MLRFFLKGFSIGIAVLAFLIFGAVFFIGLFMPTCDEDSEAVSYARSISEERLKILYLDMEKYSEKRGLPVGGYYAKSDKSNLPKEFDDLIVSRIRPEDGDIMVEGCFDHYVYMKFEGIGHLKQSSKRKQIVLSWGEGPNQGSEVLWSKDN